MRRTFLIAAGIVTGLACVSSGYEQARKQDTVEAYRGYLRSATPDDPARPAARERLAELEFLQARRIDTPVAYKRFMEEFPESSRRSEAEALLENLRFDAAHRKGTAAAYEDFLRDHPEGNHAAEAREAIARLDLDAAGHSDSVDAYAAYLSRNPASPARAEIERKMDDAAFRDAKSKGAGALFGYLADRPDGAHREEARAILRRQQSLARAMAGDIVGAYADAQKLTGAEADELHGAIEAVEYRAVAALLDPAALEEFAGRHPGHASEARAAAAALRRGRGSDLRGLAARLDPSRFARPEAELLRALDAPDPRDRWLAAEELGGIGSFAAFDKLLSEAATSRFLSVRKEAFLGLSGIVGSIPPEAREAEIQRRLGQLRPVEHGGALLVKVAILEELSGAVERSLADYARITRADIEDVFCWWRIAELKTKRADPLGAAVAARTLAVEVESIARDRSHEDSVQSLLARTLCGLADQAKYARETLARAPPETAKVFPEDLVAFRNRTVEVERLTAAKLSDAEAEARGVDKYFRSCGDDDVAPRLAQGETERLAAIKDLASRRDPRATPALEMAARRDPSEKVRRAAAESLGQVNLTLKEGAVTFGSAHKASPK